MKYVKPLTEAERVTLQEAWKYGPTARVRQRAHALYLSAQGFRIPQLVAIFEVNRDTLSGWIDDWEREGVVGLFDAPRIGRPPIYNAEQQQRLRELVDEEPRQLKRAQARLAAETGKPAGTRTLTRILKNFRCVRKRCRLSLKARRDQQAFDQADKVLGGLHQLEQRGKLNVFYFDESGVSLTSVVPYARQPINETSELPAFSHQRVNLPGFMNRADELHHTTVEGRVNGRTVIAAIDQFIERLDSDVPTVVVLDNAGIHTSAEVLARRDRRLARGLIL